MKTNIFERLEEHLDRCDRVIALAGEACGREASSHAVPDVQPPRSYTRREHSLALGERLNGSRAQPAENAERQLRTLTGLAGGRPGTVRR